MRGVNRVTLIGIVVADPDATEFPDGGEASNFRIVTNESYFDFESGEKVEHTEFHRISATGNVAKICNRKVRKGTGVYIEGGLKTRSWDDSQGFKHTTTEIRVTMLEMIKHPLESEIPENNGNWNNNQNRNQGDNWNNNQNRNQGGNWNNNQNRNQGGNGNWNNNQNRNQGSNWNNNQNRNQGGNGNWNNNQNRNQGGNGNWNNNQNRNQGGNWNNNQNRNQGGNGNYDNQGNNGWGKKYNK